MEFWKPLFELPGCTKIPLNIVMYTVLVTFWDARLLSLIEFHSIDKKQMVVCIMCLFPL